MQLVAEWQISLVKEEELVEKSPKAIRTKLKISVWQLMW